MANETAADAEEPKGAASGDGDGALRLSTSDSPKALADALTANWTEAVAALSNGDVERHVRDVLSDDQMADDIAEIAGDRAVAEDTRLFRVILRLDPRQNAEFMGYEISEQGLAELAAEIDGPFPTWSANAALRIMDTDHVLTLYADATKTPRFHELDERWHQEFGAWEKLVNTSKAAGGPDVYSGAAWRTRAKIFRGLLDTKEDESLRARSREAIQKPTVSEWAREAGSLEGAGVGTLMGVADLGGAADTFDDSRRVERKAATKKRRNGIISGVVSLSLIAGVIFAVAAFANSSTNTFNFATTKPTVTATKSVDPVTAPVIGTATITEATPLLDAPEAGAKVVQQLKEGTRVYQVAHDEKGFYLVRLADDEKVFGYVDKNVANVICPVQCG